MAKFSGNIGFVKTEETVPGVYEEKVILKHYRGDVLRKSFNSTDAGSKVINDLNLSNRISVVTNHFLIQNLQYMRFVEYLGTNWEITSVDIEYPRITLTIGGVYNGPGLEND